MQGISSEPAPSNAAGRMHFVCAGWLMTWTEAFERMQASRNQSCQLLAMAWFVVSTSRNPDLQATLMDRPPTAGVMCNILDSLGVAIPVDYVEILQSGVPPDTENPSVH